MSDSFSAEELRIIRRAYAVQVVTNAGVDDARLEAAFARVERERYLLDTAWLRPVVPMGPAPLPRTSPVIAYQDTVLSLNPETGVNNGQPSLHAIMIGALDLRDGKRVTHIGTGTGYYTAILSELVGASGHVLAVEYDPDLAAIAARNLRDRPNVTVVCGDGATYPTQQTDAVYVNFMTSRPAPAWIEHLAPGGRLIFQLGVPVGPAGRQTRYGRGCAFSVQRTAKGYDARSLVPALFILGQGGFDRDGESEHDERLRRAFEQGGADRVRHLHWNITGAPPDPWFLGDGWALSQ